MPQTQRAALLLVVGLALASAPGRAQSPQEPVAPPRTVREAYERAMEFSEPPAPGPAAGLPAHSRAHEQEGDAATIWFDPVHYLGVGGGVLLIAALGAVLYLRLTARRRGKAAAASRRRFRSLHMFLGMTAAGLGVAHALLRFWQVGQVSLRPTVSMLIVYAFVVLVVSGILRARPPRAWSRHWRIFNWAHWISAAVVLIMLALHVVNTYRVFGPGG